ncbi:MAG: SDR family NAD(P)-dependent oxidoreductase [Rhodobacteraceae bacterium]|nr:SDR family NAD(P)-dependent oxidoreductase [Paracoccaceae bacterium]
MADNRKSILITGCSSGIGYDAAHTLHKRGWRVFATCRKAADCTRLRGEGLESFPLDYEDETSISNAVQECLSRTGGTLDAVYNNGAYAIPAAVEDYPRDAFRAIFEANLFGYFDLIRQVMPLMRKQGHGRIINCSSVLGIAALRYRGAYNSTKFAMEGMTDTLRLELRGSNIHIILIEPGPITTEFRKKAQGQFEHWIDWQNSTHRETYESEVIPRLYAKPTGKPDAGELPPSAVTKKLIHALESRNPNPRYYVTWPTYLAAILKRFLSTRMLDRILSRS